jgi:predicted O-linked N-acetylglucosamine transferase (SPINDLY family)
MDRHLGIFARKPAPIQITYLAYVGTTGLDAMDWRIVDPTLEASPSRFVEKPLMIPHYWCYIPSLYNVEPGPAPNERNGFLTFGSLNSFKKAGKTTRKLWADVLRAVPTSQMIVLAPEGSHREKFLSDMIGYGIDQSRFSFVGLQPMMAYMQYYQNIDIALDTFPYTGGTTTCDALWMGVPSVTLMGALGISRMGASILDTVGLSELIARDAAEFTRIASGLAGDPGRISQLRRTMRERLFKSPLVDAKGFTRNLERAYRKAWGEWCALSGVIK